MLGADGTKGKSMEIMAYLLVAHELPTTEWAGAWYVWGLCCGTSLVRATAGPVVPFLALTPPSRRFPWLDPSAVGLLRGRPHKLNFECTQTCGLP